MEQKIVWDEKTNKCDLETKDDAGNITSEPLTPEEAAQWKAENEF